MIIIKIISILIIIAILAFCLFCVLMGITYLFMEIEEYNKETNDNKNIE